MKRTLWLKYLTVILTSSCLAAANLAQAYPAKSVYIAQAKSDYDSYMRLGYTATAKRDYESALMNFKKALTLRSGNIFATNAIRNVSNYVARQGESRLSFVPPDRGAPGNRQGGATRGGCYKGAQPLTAVMPATNNGMTTSEYPVLFFYVPATKAQTLELALLDEKAQKTYKTTIAPTQTAGIVGLKFSDLKGLPPLESGKNYHWYFSMICDSQDRSADVVVDGWVQRVDTDPALKSELQRATPSDRVALYAVNGIWYDAVAALSETRQSSPNQSVQAEEWADLLKSVGLDKIAQAPLVPCCSVTNVSQTIDNN